MGEVMQNITFLTTQNSIHVVPLPVIADVPQFDFVSATTAWQSHFMQIRNS